jgi:death-on-curing protein
VNEPIWITEDLILQLHSKLLSQSKDKDLPGLINPSIFSATLNRPQNLYCYGVGITLFDLAAAYGYGFAKNHCFFSANKRIALTSIYVFLYLNEFRLVASKEETFNYIIDLAEGIISQEDLANWLRLNSRPEQAL